jgi:hypothetical protein
MIDIDTDIDMDIDLDIDIDMDIDMDIDIDIDIDIDFNPFTYNLTLYICLFFDTVCNISFKEHLPEDGHNIWPKHVADYADHNTINVHICI